MAPDRVSAVRGLLLAGLSAALVWALIPIEDASIPLRAALVTLLAALAVAAFTVGVETPPDEK